MTRPGEVIVDEESGRNFEVEFGIDIDSFRRFAVLRDRIKHATTELEVLSDEMKKLQEQLISVLEEKQLGKITVVVGATPEGAPVKRTVYPKRQLWAGYKNDMESLSAALVDSGLGDYVKSKPNMNSLSAYVREFDPNNNTPPSELIKKLPEGLQPHIKVSEKKTLHSIVTR